MVAKTRPQSAAAAPRRSSAAPAAAPAASSGSEAFESPEPAPVAMIGRYHARDPYNRPVAGGWVTTRGGGIDLFGGLMVVLSALCYSSLGIFGKIALREGMPLTSLLPARFTLGAAVRWAAVVTSPLR